MSDIQPGPCAVCGLRNYSLSFGGPTICPACDVGDSGPSRMNAQRQRIETLERELAERTQERDEAHEAVNRAMEKIEQSDSGGGQKLWLWRNFVDGRPEYWAFDNPFPIGVDHDDPQTLGEPCGYALVKPSRCGRTDVDKAEVLRAIKGAKSVHERGGG